MNHPLRSTIVSLIPVFAIVAVGALPQNAEANMAQRPNAATALHVDPRPPLPPPQIKSHNQHTDYHISITFPFCDQPGTEQEGVKKASLEIRTGPGMPYRLSDNQKMDNVGRNIYRFFLQEWRNSTKHDDHKKLEEIMNIMQAAFRTSRSGDFGPSASVEGSIERVSQLNCGNRSEWRLNTTWNPTL